MDIAADPFAAVMGGRRGVGARISRDTEAGLNTARENLLDMLGIAGDLIGAGQKTAAQRVHRAHQSLLAGADPRDWKGVHVHHRNRNGEVSEHAMTADAVIGLQDVFAMHLARVACGEEVQVDRQFSRETLSCGDLDKLAAALLAHLADNSR